MAVSQVALDAQQQDMTTAGWAWIGTMGVDGAEGEAAAPERNSAKRALFGWLFTQPFHTESAATTQFYANVKRYGERDFNLSITSVNALAGNLWNSVFLYAHAATRVLEAGGAASDGTALVEVMKNLPPFTTGGKHTVKLDENGDMIEPYAIMNYVTAEGEMQKVQVAMYAPVKLNLGSESEAFNLSGRIKWPGDTEKTPRAFVTGHTHAHARTRTHMSTHA